MSKKSAAKQQQQQVVASSNSQAAMSQLQPQNQPQAGLQTRKRQKLCGQQQPARTSPAKSEAEEAEEAEEEEELVEEVLEEVEEAAEEVENRLRQELEAQRQQVGAAELGASQTQRLKQEANKALGPVGANVCAACARPIRERYLLEALGKQWHEDCLKCACCDCRLGEVGSSLFTHSNKLLCRRDFLRIFGRQGQCAACQRPIPPYELVMRANENAYHLDCFSCQNCRYRFCVGDRFHLTQRHKVICILCHTDAGAANLGAQESSLSASSPPPPLPPLPTGQPGGQLEAPTGSGELKPVVSVAGAAVG